MTRRRGWWLLTTVGLVLGGCSGDDSTPTGSGPTGSGGSSATGGAGGAGGSSDPGGAAGSTGGSGGTGGEAGSSGSGGSGGTTGNPDAGSGGAGAGGGGNRDAASDATPASEAGEAGRCLAAGTLTVVNQGSSGYLFNGGPLNAVLTLCRGNKYTFAINAPGHPFYIRTSTGTSFTTGITGAHTAAGDLVFDVPPTAPDMLFYQCDVHETMTGVVLIVD